MKIDCNKLDGVEKNKILSHIMLADETVARLVAETLTKENREVGVKVLFNGVECDGDVLEKFFNSNGRHIKILWMKNMQMLKS